jgi:hypothetical protein
MSNDDDMSRKLGAALKEKWGGVPPFAQDAILDQASLMEHGLARKHLRKALKDFLEKNRPAHSRL